MQFNWLWGYFIPLGILLLAWGGLPPQRARRITPLAALALALAVVGYWAVGYAFHLGGAGVVNPEDPALAGLDRIFGRDVGWGLFGLAGFGLAGDEITPTALSLFLAYLPVVATAVLLVVLALAEARRWLIVLAGGLAGGLVVPVAANWAWGGGWLSHLGETLDLGHGFVDFGGAGLMAWLPAAMVTGLLLLLPRRVVEEPPAPPPAYFPLLANAGALLLGLGWAGWALSLPLHTFGANLDLYRAAINVFLGMAGAVLTSQLYAWLVTGEIEPLMAARGLAAGWIAVLAGAPFLPPWAALVVGLVAGIAFPLLLYAIEVGLRLQDAAASVALGLTGGLWGLLAVALFADGRWGQGWNGVGAEAVAGVAGVIAGGEMGQLLAQLAGLLALGLWGLLWGALLGGLWRLTLWRPSPRRAQEPEVIEAAEEPDEDEIGEPEEPVHEQEIVPASEAEVPPLPLSVSESGE
jgi:Amt family ammonium transporter